MPNAWSLLTVDNDERQFSGNSGYDDDIGQHYSYDSTVQNSSNVQVGDLVVVQESALILGVGRIHAIEVRHHQPKERRRCPQCHRTTFKRRTVLKPRYRCPENDCLHEFDEPVVTTIKVTTYKAHYSATWQDAELPISKAELLDVYSGGSTQHSIRPLHPALLQARLSRYFEFDLLEPGVAADDALHSRIIPGGHALTTVLKRRGQRAFRLKMLERFGGHCAIKGALPAQALDAAHLYVYAETPVHDLKGGLLLRKDLHSLFDRGLLAVDPHDWKVRICPAVAGYPPLEQLDGQPLRISSSTRPLAKYLEAHLHEARQANSW